MSLSLSHPVYSIQSSAILQYVTYRASLLIKNLIEKELCSLLLSSIHISVLLVNGLFTSLQSYINLKTLEIDTDIYVLTYLWVA